MKVDSTCIYLIFGISLQSRYICFHLKGIDVIHFLCNYRYHQQIFHQFRD